MADTFEEIWRSVRLYSPDVPVALCQQWVRDAWRDLLRSRLWSWALAEGLYQYQSSEYSTGAIGISSNTTTVNRTADGVWTSSMIGMSIQFADYPGQWYRITNVTGDDTITIAETYTGPGLSDSSYVIRGVLLSVPSDFKAFHSVVDREAERRLYIHGNRADLDASDPIRDAAGEPVAVFDMRWEQSTPPRPLFEMWPHITSPRDIQYLYWKVSSDFSDSATLPYTIPGDVLKLGALQRLCMWPGTPAIPNIMFNMQLSAQYKSDFQMQLAMLEREDSEIYPTTQIWYDRYDIPYVPIDAKFLQRHSTVYSI